VHVQTGDIYSPDERKELDKLTQKMLVSIPPTSLEDVRAMSKRERLKWAADQVAKRKRRNANKRARKARRKSR
jgi:hypothetical protein